MADDDRDEPESESALAFAIILIVLIGCVAVGAYYGFVGAGIGGAIVGLVLGAIVGIGVAESVGRLLIGLVELVPILATLALFLGFIVLVIWGIYQLWGVGKP